MAANADSTKVVIAAMIGNGLIAISKFAAAFVTGSASTMAEAVHSVADTTNQVLLMVGLRRAKRPPTALHPLGYAVESYFWPFLVSIMIFLLGGAYAFYEGVHGLYGALSASSAHEPVEQHSHLWDYVVLGVAVVFELYSCAVAVREFRKMKGGRSTMEVILRSKDPTIPVVLMEDTAALIGLVVALLAVALSDMTGWVGWDSIGSLLIGVLLFGVSYLLSRETHSLLLGETASLEDREKVVALVESDAAIVRITQLIAIHRGASDVLVALKVGVRPGLAVDELERAIDRVEDAIREAIPYVGHIFIEPDANYDADKDLGHPEGLAKPPSAAST